MNEYNQRQYDLMLRCIEGLEAENLTLIVLINSLRSLLGVLEKPDEQWKSSFKEQWWILEEIYSIASDRGQPYLSRDDETLICETLVRMKELVNQVIVD